MIPDIFNSSLFTLTELTATTLKLPYVPTRLADLGLWDEAGIATLDAWIEEFQGTLELVDVKPRNAPGQVLIAEKRTGRSFRIAHLPEQDNLMADEVLGVRAFGSQDMAMTLTMLLNQRLAKARRNIDYTIESHRVQNLLGNFIDANGSAINAFTTFGVSQQTIQMQLTTGTTAVRSKCLTIIEAVEDALGGLPFTGILVLCGKNFWPAFITHPNVEKFFLNYIQAADLRGDPRMAFEFGNITWERYRGTSAVKIPDGEAYAIPLGVPGLFITRFGPANYIETTNTMGLPYYAKSEPLELGKGIKLEMQSNPLNLCTRPAAVIKLLQNT
jgi:hypothetical protein